MRPRTPFGTTGLALSLLLLSCGDPVGPTGDAITELPRALSASEVAVIDGSRTFGLELLRESVARDERANVVLSPLSASMALGMTLNGTDGATFEDMRTTLAFGGMSQDEINDAYASLLELLTTLDPSVRFDIANAIWTNAEFPFHASFLDAVGEAFNATSGSRDFADPATLDEINGWVDDATQGYIDRILDELDPEQVALLVNAIFFDAAWTTQFDPAETRSRSFRRPDDTTVDVDMMSISDVEFPFRSSSDYVAAELPYGGGAFGMVVVVPFDDARGFVAELDEDRWEGIVGSLSPTVVDGLSIPKFTLTHDTYLNDALQAMGMRVAFTPEADFTRMSPIGDRLCIDFVRQKTFIEVDERGTTAAAVTAVGVGLDSFIGLTADRPFVFAIRERLSGTILFTGLVTDPTAEDPGPIPFTDLCG